jgi:beta-glucanase (GH16 family)
MQEWYTSSPNNVRTENGELVITAQEEHGASLSATQELCWNDCSQQCTNTKSRKLQSLNSWVAQCGQNRCTSVRFTSGRILTAGKFSVGPTTKHQTMRISARIQVPIGQGLWPAFWMYPEDPPNAKCGGCGSYGPWPAGGELA